MCSAASFKGLMEFSPGFAARPQISHVVFDFDGTLSWLARGWPELMRQVLREQLAADGGKVDQDFEETVMADILGLNGKATIHQMRQGAERLRARGVSPPEPEELRQEYQRRLDAVVAGRTERILSGQVRREDFVVHGARRLLEALAARGLTLIILSGKVEHRVKEEAELLDLARYFGDHIYGDRADVAESSKRAVISRLLREEGIAGERLLSFGDGPVEVEVTKAAGGLAVGVASDEERHGAGAMEPAKRKVLAAAGADVLIPDYHNAAALVKCILGR